MTKYICKTFRGVIKIRRYEKYYPIILLILVALLVTLLVQNLSSSKNTVKTNAPSVKEKKIVYLTFDDGPTTHITPKVLDILKKEKVKCTFFVVGKQIEQREKILHQIYKDGHALGLHTFNHNFNIVYNSDETFVKEMLDTQKILQKNLKVKFTAIRFPGGSQQHLTKSLYAKLKKYNFKIYDWNMCLNDGLNANIPTLTLIKEATENKKHFSRIFLLMHCNENNKNTCIALPQIIKYYKKNGYVFKKIEDDTPEYHFRFKK